LSLAATDESRVQDYFAARALVAQAGIPQAEAREVGSLAEVGAAAAAIGYPVALKALGAAHKSDSGAVRLGIEDRAALERAFESVRSASPIGRFSVERMAPTTDGVEMIVGVRRDASFGPVVVVGLGGIYAEVFNDLAVSLLPTTAAELQRSVLALRCAPLLVGARGRPPVDVAALSRAAVALGELVARRDDVEDVEINPLLVLSDGVVALDARVVSSPKSEPDPTPRALRSDEQLKEVEA
jgi:succinyl-CoA synthetase beta subunit